MTSCPVDQANRGLKLINDGVAYISFMTNLTTIIPISVDGCYSRKDTRKCLIDLVAETSKTIVEAPGKIVKFSTSTKLFMDQFSIFMAICFVDATFAAQAQTMQYGIDVTACFARNLIG